MKPAGNESRDFWRANDIPLESWRQNNLLIVLLKPVNQFIFWFHKAYHLNNIVQTGWDIWGWYNILCDFYSSTFYWPSMSGNRIHFSTGVWWEGPAWLQDPETTHTDAPSNHGVRVQRLPTWYTSRYYSEFLGSRYCFGGTVCNCRFAAQGAPWDIWRCCTIDHKGSCWKTSLHLDECCDFPAEIDSLLPIPNLVLRRVPSLQEQNLEQCPTLGGLVLQLPAFRCSPTHEAWKQAFATTWAVSCWYLDHKQTTPVSGSWTSWGLGVSQVGVAVSMQLEGWCDCRNMFPMSCYGPVSRFWLTLLEYGWWKQHMVTKGVWHHRLHLPKASFEQCMTLSWF